jgi:spermidine synthase
MTPLQHLATSQGRVAGWPQRQYVELWLASFVGLYFEMLVVRWLAAEVRLFSYFKNLTMMAAFMGLGIGFALVRRGTDYRPWFAPLLALYVPLVLGMSAVTGFKNIILPQGGEAVWRTVDLPPVVSAVMFAAILTIFFIFTILLFLPLGQLTGRLMVGLPPLYAYIANILGSLAGLWVFSAVSYLNAPPWTWFAVGLLVLLWFLRGSRRALAGSLACAAAIVLLLVVTQGRSTIWSPYYRLDLLPLQVEGRTVANPEETGYHLYANQIGHMEAVNLSAGYRAAHPEYESVLRAYQTIYDLPYSLKEPRSVLVVGSGMGNDVAAAVRHNVPRVDAVEIDPTIYDLGSRLHPERPYSAPGVRVIIDDARSYLEKTDQQYDLIVFGILDSQTMLSGMSNVRLDNFVYTVESLQQAQRRLSKDGMIALSFDVERWWIKQRLAETMVEAFGEPPVQLAVNGTPWTIYLSGYRPRAGELEVLCGRIGCQVEKPLQFDTVPLATDDWPYLYLEGRGIPLQYWIMFLVIVATAWAGTRRAFPDARHIDLHFFLLGAAFMLIEFKSITELALLFGSTWIVNVIAVSAVLVMVLLANLLVSRLRRVNVTALYVLLFAALAVEWALPLRALLPYAGLTRAVASGLLMGLPLFFAAAIFSVSLKSRREITVAFASNFFGSVVGGMIEYGSMAFGLRSLYVFAAVLYALSWVARGRDT